MPSHCSLLRPARVLAASLGGVALAAGVAAAAAGDVWLVPGRAALPAGVDATFDLATGGGGVPEPDPEVTAGQVTRARVRLAGRDVPLPAPTRGPHALRFRVPLRQPGVATVSVSLAPRRLSLDSAAVIRYLEDAGAPDTVRLAYLRQLPIAGVRRWNERYARHAVAHVLVTSPLRPRPEGDSSWARPVGLALELLPLDDPTTLRAGDALDVRLLYRGRPLPHALVRAVAPDGHLLPGRRTDADGRTTLPLATSGRWLLRATEIRRAGRGGDWAADFATLALAVR